MLQATYSETQEPQPEAQGLTPAYILDVVRRRWIIFLAAFVTILIAGLVVLKLLPAIYLSEGRILVESQLIPSELVRPTVTALANERIETIQQRIMTRDKLLGIANKFKLFSGNQEGATQTEMLDFMRDRTQIKPYELKIQSNRSANRQAIAFSVGFEHENPQTAMRVANEFVTMILDEDIRTRTAYASETTRFLEREVKRLESEMNAVEAQIADYKTKQLRNPIDELQAKQLMLLRSELTQKSAVYAPSHPDVTALKRRITAIEKILTPALELGQGLEVLERNRENIQKAMEGAAPKLAAARMGESLERAQQAERLEVIEQATVPQKPIKPNRLKLLLMIFAAACGVGGGIVVLLEMLDTTVRRSSDLYKFVDSQLVVSIPIIHTAVEKQRSKRRIVVASAAAIILIAIGIGGTLFVLNQPELLNQMRAVLHL